MPSRKRPTAPKASRPKAQQREASEQVAPPLEAASPPAPLPHSPPNAPPETLAHDVVTADPAVSAPPPRKVGVQRIAGAATSERLLMRRAFRPAGNSAVFWRRIEAEDPFLTHSSAISPLLAGPGHGLATASLPTAAERMDRSVRAPTTEMPLGPMHKPTPPKSAQKRPAPAPRAVPDRPAQAAPGREAKPAPRQPKPQVSAPQDAAPPKLVDRRPPRILDAHKRLDGAKPSDSAPDGVIPRPQVVDPSGRSPADVRREKEAARAPAGVTAPPSRGLEEILGLMSDLAASETVYRQQLAEEASLKEQGLPVPPREPAQKAAPRQVRSKPAQPASVPVAPEPVQKVDRSPRAARPAGLDDIVGGAGETRMRIGKRSVRKAEPDSEPEG